MAVFRSIIITFVLCFVVDCTVGVKLKWKQLLATNMTVGPAPRRDMAIGYHEGTRRLFIFGGRGAKQAIYDDTWLYDFQLKKWEEVKGSKLTPEKRFTMAFGVYDEKMYISTGEGPGKVFYNDVWEFDFGSHEWRKLPQGANPPEERYGAAGGIYPGESLLWMSHGFATKRYSNTFTYDILRQRWVEEFTGTNSYNPMYPHNRCVQGSTPVTPDHLLIYGGCLGGGKTGGPCPSADTWLFNRLDKTWKRLPECLSPRMFPAIAVLPMGKRNLTYRAVMFGGGQNRPIEDTDEMSIVEVDKAENYELGIFILSKTDKYDDDPDVEWEQRRVDDESNIPAWRMGHSMITVDTNNERGILMFGGVAGGKLQNDIWLLEGDVDGAGELDFIGDGCHSKYWSLIHFHGLFMFLGWGLFMVAGVFIARYFRHKDPLWFHLHRICQIIGLLFSCAGFICGVMSVPFDHFEYVHGGIGLALMILVFLQLFNGLLRPHFSDGKEKTIFRKIWEVIHVKFLGRYGMLFAQINICLGMFLAVVPTAVYAVWFAYLGVWVLLFIIMEIVKCRRECGKRLNPAASGSYELNKKL